MAVRTKADASNRTARLLSSAASDNATVACDTDCVLLGVQLYNAKATAVYLKLYNKATAPASTDTPIKTLYIPGSSLVMLDFPTGIDFPLGLGYRLVTGSADNDATAVAAGDVLALNLDYIR